MTVPARLRRSELSTPGTSPRMMGKAAAGAADLVFLDLEDSVSPGEKVGARDQVVDALHGHDFPDKTVAVRINPAASRWGHADLVDLVARAGARIDVVIVPKVTAPRDVWFVETLLTALEDEHGLGHRIGIEVLVEEAEALARVEEIAACSDRLEALILGVGDLSASLGMRTGHVGSAGGYPGDIWHHARVRLLAAARAHGLDPVDGPFANFRDADGYRRQAEWAAALGFVGKWAIHPAQVEIANEVFTPTDDEVARARKVVAAVDEAEASGAGAADLGGVMIDAATARIFRTTLATAERIAAKGRPPVDPDRAT